MQLAVSYARDHLYFDAGTCVYRQSGDKSNVPDTDLDDHEGSDLHCGREARRYVWRDEEEMLEKILSEITHKT